MPDAFDDEFADVGAAPVAKFPTVAQLASDGPKLDLTYAKGDEDNEQTKPAQPGRLLIIRPVKLEKNVPSNIQGNAPADRMSVNVVILDGPPIENTLDKDGDITSVFPEPLVPGKNAELAGMYISGTVLLGQLKPLMVNGDNAPGKVTYGRLFKLPPKKAGGNKPWALGRATDPKQDAADRKLAAAWVKAHPEPDAFA